MASPEPSRADVLRRLHEVILERKALRPDRSYVVKLLDGGIPAIAAKVREEAEELIEAASGADPEHTANECADLLFHTWVLLAHSEISPDRVFEILESRFGVGGLDEKASRGQGSLEDGAER
jgi:phosphoribosyl-ATP pyrophosphohydrolase